MTPAVVQFLQGKYVHAFALYSVRVSVSRLLGPVVVSIDTCTRINLTVSYVHYHIYSLCPQISIPLNMFSVKLY